MADVKKRIRKRQEKEGGPRLSGEPDPQSKFLAEQESNFKRWNSPIIPAVVVIVCLLPFINKAFHIDDPLFLWTARQILTHPLDFYGFQVNWYLSEEPMYEVTKNPPLASYYIAAVASFFGFKEVPLHVAFILPAVAAAVGTFYLARRFCSDSLSAALIAVLNPVFLVSATTLMCDTMMLAFWVWTLFFWIKWIDTQKNRFLLLASILLTLCTLTKYFGLALVPLIGVYTLVQKKKLGSWTFYLLVPVAVFALYQYWTFSLYGKGLFSDVFPYASGRNSWAFSMLFKKSFFSLVFTGGCLLTILFYSPVLWSYKVLRWWIAAIPVIIVVLYFFSAAWESEIPARKEFRWNLIVAMGLMSAAGVGVLGLAFDEIRNRKDSSGLLLFLWVTGTFFFSAFVNWTINARSLLPVVPAVGILAADRLRRSVVLSGPNRFARFLPLLPAAAIAMSVAWADYSLAGTTRTAADEIQREFASDDKRGWFGGHWGFQYYMQAAGHKPLFLDETETRPGDFVVMPHNNTNIVPLRVDKVILKRTLKYMPCPWLSTMQYECGAGFYAQEWGPVPFTFGRVNPEVYRVFQRK